MEEISSLAAAETINVLYNTDISLFTKIPYAIIKVLEDKAHEYNGKIKLNMALNLAEQEISEEAQTILAIIYKDYLCTTEKHEEMNKIFLEKSIEYDEEEKESLNPFKDDKKTRIQKININLEEDNELIELPKKWYLNIFDKIIKFFQKK